MEYDFDKVINRRGTFSTQWDYIEDRFGEKDLLPFSISDTDFQIPEVVYKDLKTCLDHRIFGYTRWNHEEFKGAIEKHFLKRYHTSINKDWILYSPSVIYSAAVLLRMISLPGDGVLVLDPMYDAFLNVIQKNNRLLVSCQLDNNTGYRIDFELFEKQLHKVKIFLLCSPHNPTGRVFTQEELQRIIELCKQYDVFIISDEIHSDILLHGNQHLPVVKFYEQYENIALISSASKTFNTPGLGGSYLMVPREDLREEFLIQTRQRDALNSANIMGMQALISSYNKADDYIDELILYVEENMKLIEEFVKKELPQIRFQCPQATYLAWLDIRKVPFTSAAVQRALVQVGKVGIMAGEVYGSGGEHFLRLNAGCPKSKLIEGLKRMKCAFDALARGDLC